jgi:para-nitrobenzyl esterase
MPNTSFRTNNTIALFLSSVLSRTLSRAVYHGDSLVATSNNTIIVVTLNYRLSIFGFLGGTAIGAQTTDRSQGNFGIQDQRMAMKWVKEHIVSFGGDPEQITIFGESAGGNSVFNHLAQPQSFLYYNQAIIESGVYNEGAFQLPAANQMYTNVLSQGKCPSLECLREKTAVELLTIFGQLEFKGIRNWGPIVDGISLTATPEQLLKRNRVAQVPVILGSNRDEMAFWTLKSVPSNCNESCFETDFSMFVKGASGGRKIVNASELKEVKRIYANQNSDYVYPKDLGKYSTW